MLHPSAFLLFDLDQLFCYPSLAVDQLGEHSLWFLSCGTIPVGCVDSRLPLRGCCTNDAMDDCCLRIYIFCILWLCIGGSQELWDCILHSCKGIKCQPCSNATLFQVCSHFFRVLNTNRPFPLQIGFITPPTCHDVPKRAADLCRQGTSTLQLLRFRHKD